MFIVGFLTEFTSPYGLKTQRGLHISKLPSWLHLLLADWFGSVGSLSQGSHGMPVCQKKRVVQEVTKTEAYGLMGHYTV